MPDRFFVDRPLSLQRVLLSGTEAHHLAHVLRARVGAEVILFDGGGAEFLARVRQVGRKAVELEVVERRDVDRELPFRLTLAVALPKGERQRWLVEKAVELGVTCLVPLITARGVVQVFESRGTRLERAVIEASKQCGRNRLMNVAPATELRQFLLSAPGTAERWIAHPSPPAAPLADDGMRTGDDIYCAIGPEGGFTELEIELAADSGWQPIYLGPRILRVETAAIALAALLTLLPKWRKTQ